MTATKTVVTGGRICLLFSKKGSIPMFKFKKLASAVLACAMILALAIPAFAEGEEGGASSGSTAASYTYSEKNTQNVTMKGATATAKIQVSLPSGAALTNSFVLNPYNVKYKLAVAGATEAEATEAEMAKQVVSPILNIANNTNCKMQVDVTVTTTLGGNLKLLTAPYENNGQQTDTKNNAFLFVNMTANNAAAATSSTAAINTYNENTSIVLKAGDVKKTNFLQTNAAPSTGPNFIWIQFGGAMAQAATTPWTEKDTATVAFAFTFTPNPNAAASST